MIRRELDPGLRAPQAVRACTCAPGTGSMAGPVLGGMGGRTNPHPWQAWKLRTGHDTPKGGGCYLPPHFT